MIVVDPNGRLESDLIQADTVIVSGAVRSDITAKRVEIRSTGKVWGNVTAVRFSTEEGAYLRGKIQMEEELESEAKADPDDSGEEKIPDSEED
jgi:cytoskeletal protein CcmA (bactofilin family)